ncbi:class I SAM-dependent methyltransferase [Chitinispirillales bacterium ANBcel5]|uniref:class I SAM-dependent methyltransferase n=1 Tax=Cellulosispirillum alkaliphilum TaxID=3039283 RepID=UPI002A559499|nr:class I SAM-dependent methyltransferase [Chitinispirillales bacterium ANBcel5]
MMVRVRICTVMIIISVTMLGITDADVMYVPAPVDVIEQMLEIADVGEDDLVYDLGCGDARIAIAAVTQRGARAVGIDNDRNRIRLAINEAEYLGIKEKIQFVQGDLFGYPVTEATVVMIYLDRELNQRLRYKLLKELRPGSKVVSHEYCMEDWRADMIKQVRNSKVYMWIIPANISGLWRLYDEEQGEKMLHMQVVQRFQDLEIEATSAKGEAIQLKGSSLQGASMRIMLQGTDKQYYLYRAKFDGEKMVGEVVAEDGTMRRWYGERDEGTRGRIFYPASGI